VHDLYVEEGEVGVSRQSLGKEIVIWQGSPGQIKNVGYFLVCLLTSWLIVPIALAGWRWLSTRMLRYELTSERLRISGGVLNRHTDEVELYRIKDYIVDEPFLLRVCGRGNLAFPTSDRSNSVVRLIAVQQPQQVCDLIRNAVEHCRAAKGTREID
jgi:uncharacterized membrane protein YdbT with pleckstrin-like domain